MAKISASALKIYRARTYRLVPKLKLTTPEAAVEFVNERGFVYFWPITGVELPSLWAAVAGQRPVADKHDDPGHITWGWKDSLLGARRWHYAKLLRGKATMVSLDTLPHFYALSENYGDYTADYMELFVAGRMTAEARAVYEALLDKGPLHTIALRKEARLTSKESSTRFEKALVELQAGLKIMPIGVAQVGAWKYSFIYEIVDRHYPDLAERAGKITRATAHQHLLELYLASVGAATEREAQKLFHWTLSEIQHASTTLVEQGRAERVDSVANQKGAWLATPELS